MSDEVGPYRLVRPLGQGGMGTVWEAVDTTRNGRRVALKVLQADLFNDPELEERFRQECELAATIEHPHVVPVYDFEVSGRPYIAMRIIKGTDLASVIEQGPLSPQRAVAIVEQVASALQAAHLQKLRHRDVKPSNILLQPGARPGTDHAWLIDWGIAQPIDITHAPVTRNGQIVGTPAYIAPERLEAAGKADHRADVYSLAIVLYECLAGHKPFEGHDDIQILLAPLREEPKPLPSHIPARLRDVVTKGLKKDPDKRYQTAPALAEAARAALQEQQERRSTVELPPTNGTGGQLGLSVVAAAVFGVLVALGLRAAGWIDWLILEWVGPLLAIAAVALLLGVRGWSRPDTADESPAGPSDPTREPSTGGLPSSQP